MYSPLPSRPSTAAGGGYGAWGWAMLPSTVFQGVAVTLWRGNFYEVPNWIQTGGVWILLVRVTNPTNAGAPFPKVEV